MVFNLVSPDSSRSSSFSTSEAALPTCQPCNYPDGCLRALVSRPVFTESKGQISRLTIFKYDEILKITKQFGTKIGEGAFGKVYLAKLKEDTKVAVKVLSKSSWQGSKQFLDEAQLLTTVQHGNLISLIGYCDDSENKALVYEFMANGNLRQHLSGEDVGLTWTKPNVLTWERRLRIAVHVAQGLNYLHNDCNPSIIHRDIKTTNILLNENMQAKISDFGLSRPSAAANGSYMSTSPLGTCAYLPPEYEPVAHEINKKSDVYSFGIVLLELISGHVVINTMGDGKSVHICEWAIPKFKKGNIRRLIDPKVEEKFDIDSAKIAAKVAESCTQQKPDARPDIYCVLAELKRAIELASKHKYVDGDPDEFCPPLSQSPSTSISEGSLPTCQPRNPALPQSSSSSTSEAALPACQPGMEGLKSYNRGGISRMRRKRTKGMGRLRSFNYGEIKRITGNFGTEIGEGGYGKVYLGTLKNGTKVAVKMLSEKSWQGDREFEYEEKHLMIAHHGNLIFLHGSCDHSNKKALVYEYMANGNLQEHLHGDKPILTWKQRLHIIVDVAKGLEYLHNGCNPPIIHRDLKATNILLNEKMQAKISDFGLSKTFTAETNAHVSTRAVGTLGYLDPEYHSTANLNKKSDVFSLGIILLELITRHPAMMMKPEGNVHILNWANSLIESKNLQKIMDPKLKGEFDSTSAWKVIQVAESCTKPTGNQRPDIDHVLAKLKDCLETALEPEKSPEDGKQNEKVK